MLLAERDGGKGYTAANIVRLRVQNDLLGSFARMLISLHWQLMGIQFTICSQKKSKLGSIRSKLGEQSYTVLLCVNNKKKTAGIIDSLGIINAEPLFLFCLTIVMGLRRIDLTMVSIHTFHMTFLLFHV